MQVTIYIRKSEEDYWNAIRDKSRWVNDKLSEARGDRILKVPTKDKITPIIAQITPIKQAKDAPKFPPSAASML